MPQITVTKLHAQLEKDAAPTGLGIQLRTLTQWIAAGRKLAALVNAGMWCTSLALQCSSLVSSITLHPSSHCSEEEG